LILNKYFFKPIFEKRGSLDIKTPVVAIESQRVFQKCMIEADTMFKVKGQRLKVHTLHLTPKTLDL
jgi:hypothetical protein